MTFTLLMFGVIVLALVAGAAGGFLCLRVLGRTRTPTPLSPSGYVCEDCGSPALPHRTHDGRRVCAGHKAG